MTDRYGDSSKVRLVGGLTIRRADRPVMKRQAGGRGYREDEEVDR